MLMDGTALIVTGAIAFVVAFVASLNEENLVACTIVMVVAVVVLLVGLALIAPSFAA